MNRRFSLVLSVAAIAALTTGCATFSDSGNIARVGDETLTLDDFQAQLAALGAPTDQVLSGEGVRGELTRWIQEQIANIDDPDAAAGVVDVAGVYDAGFVASGTFCLRAIVVDDEETANRLVAELDGGAEFADVFTTENKEPGLVAVGGDIGCATAEQLADTREISYVQVATTLSVDDPLGVAPLPDPQGIGPRWLLMSFLPFSELAPEDLDVIGPALDTVAGLTTRLAAADVFVDPRYGIFDAATGQVVALG